MQGRGEFVRLALEEAGAEYADIVRESLAAKRDRTAPAVRTIDPARRRHSHLPRCQHLDVPRTEARPGAAGPARTTLGQRVAVDDHRPGGRSTRHAPPDCQRRLLRGPDGRRACPLGRFRRKSRPKFLGYFERVLTQNPDGNRHCVGSALSYVDLSLFQVVAGLRYAFPRATASLPERSPAVWRCTRRCARARTSRDTSLRTGGWRSTRTAFFGITRSSIVRTSCVGGRMGKQGKQFSFFKRTRKVRSLVFQPSATARVKAVCFFSQDKRVLLLHTNDDAPRCRATALAGYC